MPVNPAIFVGPGPVYTRNGKGEPAHTGKKYIVIHPAAPAGTADPLSAHYRCLPDVLMQLLDTDWRAQHTGSKPGCDYGIAYAFTGTPPWQQAPWNVPVWPLLVEQVAADCAAHGIEPRTLTARQIEAGTLTGIVAEGQLAAVFEGGKTGRTYLPLGPLCGAVYDLLHHGVSPRPAHIPSPGLVRPAAPPPEESGEPPVRSWRQRLRGLLRQQKNLP